MLDVLSISFSLEVPQVTRGYLKIILWTEACWKGSIGLSRLNLRRLPLVPHFFLRFCNKKKKTPKKFCGLSLRIQTEPSEGDPVRFVRGPSDAMFLPGQSGRGTPRPSLGVKWAAAWSLDERSKGSPCRKLHRAGLYPPPGTDGTPSLVCPSASRSGAERSKSQRKSENVICFFNELV